MALKEIIGAALTSAIAARFLKREEAQIEPNDVELILLYFSNGRKEVTFKEKDLNNRFLVSIEAASELVEDFMSLEDSEAQSIITKAANFVNQHKRISQTYHRLEDGGATLHIHHHEDEIQLVIHFNDDTNFDLFLTLTDPKATTSSGFGVKELSHDYGLQRHIKYLHALFAIDIPAQIAADYFTIAHNNGSPTSDTIFSATQYLYNYIAEEIKQLVTSDETEYQFLSNLIKGIQGMELQNNSNYEVVRISPDSPDYDIMDYDQALKYIQLIDLDAKVPDDKTPMLKVFDKNSGKDIFQIRTKKEKYANAPTGHRYKIYFEPGSIFNYIIKTAEKVNGI